MSHDVAVIGLGRVGLPLAITFADHGLSVLGVDKDAERLETLRAGRMPFKEPGTEEPLARVLDAERLGALRARRRRRAGGGDRAHARDADASRTSRSTCRTSAPCSTRCCRTCARATCWCCARPSRRTRPSSSPATWRSTAASASARTSSSRTCPSGSPPTASWRRSGRCRASSAASARRRASAPRGCSSCSARRSCRRRRCRPSWPRSGRTSCATRRSRCRTC